MERGSRLTLVSCAAHRNLLSRPSYTQVGLGEMSNRARNLSYLCRHLWVALTVVLCWVWRLRLRCPGAAGGEAPTFPVSSPGGWVA